MAVSFDAAIIILIRLLIAHVVSDFVFQPKAWVHQKRLDGVRSSAFFKHIAVVGTSTFLLAGQFTATGLLLAAIVMLTHAMIDLWKIRFDKSGSLFYFLMDQLLHVVVLVVAWFFLFTERNEILSLLVAGFHSSKFMGITLGYLFCIFPCNYLIKFATQHMIVVREEEMNVKRGGRLIGIFERIIIFTFVLFDQYAAIGFLITGKSILRFGDGQRKETEYVLVGTMISYALAILAGVIVNLCIVSAN